MICYRYEGDRLVTCEDYGYAMLMRPPLDRETSRRLFVGRSHRERRRLARARSGRGRRRARAVSAWPAVTMRDPVRYDGHLLGFDTVRVRLYLPQGVTITQAHLDDVTRVSRARGVKP